MSSTSKGPILVVDDDEDIRDALRDTLEEQGYEIAQAGDGLAALGYLRTNPAPPLILLDWNMAPMNAPAFMAEFVKEPSFAQVPVVLLTADARVKEKAANGYAGYLRKPLNLDALFDVVKRFVN
jgi:CheY-like chemotaxis protein